MADPKQLQNLRVSALNVNSTRAALVVHTVDESGAYVSPGAGSTSVSIKGILSADGSTSLVDSTNNSLGVTIRAGSAAGTEYADGDTDATPNFGAVGFNNGTNTMRVVSATTPLPVSTGPVQVSSVGGAVIVRSSAANALVTAYQSTYTDFNGLMRIADRDASTQTAAVLNSTPPSTAYGIVTRMAAPYADSTNNAIRVFTVASSGGAGSTEVTIRQSTFTDLNCRINAPSTANSSNYLPVRITDGSSYITPGNEYTDGSTASSLAGPALLFNNGTNNTMRMVGITQGLPVNVVAGSAASTIVTVSTGSVRVHQSTAADLNVTVAGYSTTVNVSSLAGAVIVRSSAASLLASVYQSTAADLNVTVAGYSTTVNVSSLGGAVITRSSAADSLHTVYQSTASALQATARINTSSGGAVEGSTAQPAGNAIGLHVRQLFPTLNSTTILITSTNSTAIYALVSSVAAMRHKVYAYFVGSTHTNPSTLVFCSSANDSGFDHWHVNFGSGSSGITGANMAVTPPGWIFAGVAQNALNVRIEGGSSATSTVIARISLSWFDEA